LAAIAANGNGAHAVADELCGRAGVAASERPGDAV